MDQDLKQARLQFETLNLSWRGEPLLHPEIEPILEFCTEQVQKGVFQRLQIETSGAFLSEKLAEFAQKNIPQTWVVDLERGDGLGVDLLLKNQGIHTQVILKHWIYPNCNQTAWHQYGRLPIWIGSQPPTEGNWFWFARLEQENFFLDQQTDSYLEQLAQEFGVKIQYSREQNKKCLAAVRSMVVSWDGKVSLCPRDVQLQNYWRCQSSIFGRNLAKSRFSSTRI